MYLLSSAGIVDHRFGILTQPDKGNASLGIKHGMAWAADNGAFTGKFDPDGFVLFLNSMLPYCNTCLFVVVPDTLADPVDTLAKWEQYHGMFSDWPLAYVAQDGSEAYPIPEDASTLFIGGLDKWKDSSKPGILIRQAQARGMHIHVGRVNEWRRYRNFSRLENGKGFTCDGTKQRFIGRERSIKLYWSYMERYRRQLHLPISGSDYLSQP